MENILIIIIFMLIGVALRRLTGMSDKAGNVLNSFVLYVSLPALVLLKIPELVFSDSLLVLGLMPWLMLLLSSSLILMLSRLLEWDRATTGCFLLLIPLGNTSFLGIPMVKVFFGDAAIPYALLYDQLGSFLALATYGSLILCLYGTNAGKLSARNVLLKIVTFPPFVALLLAFALKTVHYPSMVTGLLRILSSTLVPLVMIAVGFQLNLRLTRGVTSQLCIGLLIKLIIAPVSAYFLCRIAGLDDDPARISIFEAGMPPMVSAGALALSADLSPALTAAFVGIGLVLSFVTLPMIHHILM